MVSNLDTLIEFVSVCVLFVALTDIWDRLRGRSKPLRQKPVRRRVAPAPAKMHPGFSQRDPIAVAILRYKHDDIDIDDLEREIGNALREEDLQNDEGPDIQSDPSRRFF